MNVSSGIGWSPYQNVGALTGSTPTPAVQPMGQSGSFAQQIGQYVSQVNDMQIAADSSAKGMVLGDVRSMHAVMIAGEEANLALSTVIQARNKVLDAYHEIMRMQV